MNQNLKKCRFNDAYTKLLAGSFLAAFLFIGLNTQAQVVSTVAGDGVGAGFTYCCGTYSGIPGPATDAGLYRPIGVCLDDSGNIYIADQANNYVHKVSLATGIITNIAGTGTPTGNTGYNGDNIQATAAELYYPDGVAVDDSGNVYIADEYNNRVRKVTKATGIITTIAGNGTEGYNADNIQATDAELDYPYGLALDDSGNLYITDQNNNRIREVNKKTGIIQTIAGGGANPGSDGIGDWGPATGSSLSDPGDVALDTAGNIYITDSDNQRIRKITKKTGIITTIAGNGTAGYSGNGGTDTLTEMYYPSGLAVDDSGNVYFADDWNDVIRKINQHTNILSLYAGNAYHSYTSWGSLYPAGGYVNGPALTSEFSGVSGVALDACGNLYVADYYNNVIREISAPAKIATSTAKALSSVICSGQTVSFTDSSNFSVTSWKWHFPGGTPDSSASQNPVGIKYATGGTYDVIMTASSYCLGSITDTTIHIKVGITGALTFVPQSPPLCGGKSVTLKVMGNDTIFKWSPSAGLSKTTGDTVVATPSVTTTYTITGVSSGGCVSTGADTVTVIPVPILTIQPQSKSLCSGTSVTLTVDTSGKNYVWSPSSTLSSSAGDTVVATPTATTTYTVTGTDSTGCQFTGTDVITFLAITPFYITPQSPSTCVGGSVTLSVPSGTTYTWSPSTGLNATTGNSVTATPIIMTVYTVSGPGSGGCPSSGTDTVFIVPAPPFNILPPEASTCVGQPVALTVSDTLGKDYVWTPLIALNPDTGITVNVSPTIQTTYTVTGLDSMGCPVSAMDTVSVVSGPNTPSISLSNNTVLTSSATQGNQWYKDGNMISGATNETLTISDTGCYYVIATNPANGCTSLSNTLCISSLASINQLSINAAQISIYPNPTGGEIFINISSSVADVKDWNLQITDVLGRTVYSRMSLNYSNDVDLSNLPGGVYFITIINNTARAVFPVVKQN